MRKHQNKGHRGIKRWKDSNTRLSESAIEAITGLLSRFSERSDGPALDYLREQYLSKYCDESLIPGVYRRTAAIKKFREAESKNATTRKFLRGLSPLYNILPRVTFGSYLRFAQRLIAEVLGPLDFHVLHGSFSGGASTSCRRTESSPAFKFVGMADVTESAKPYIDYIYNEFPLLRKHGVFDYTRVVEGSVLFTVPKKTDIDRCACKEPDINMFLQKGVGDHIRRRLLRVGINLNDQSRNRDLSRLGSLDDSLATLDLSSASDTISIDTVLALLPHDWFLYLNDIRSHNVEIDGAYHQLEMFSSMGNGFTFELESLIFWALMKTTAYFEGISGVISVYGDDIIIPSGLYDMATWTLSVFGFTANPTKSYHSGPFRESCGGHYHYGSDITPFYLKRKPVYLTDIIRVANQLRLWSTVDSARSIEVPDAYQIWCELASYVPRDLWGGDDPTVDTQLCSPNPPERKLVRVLERFKEPSSGKYLQWHSSYWNRSSLGFVSNTTSGRTSPSRCRIRRATTGALVFSNWFYQELISDTSPA